jgi:uncharacterized protein
MDTDSSVDTSKVFEGEGGGMGLVKDEGREGDWIQGFTGRRYYPADPRPGDFDILDIAHSNAMICRYTGHCSRHYSVAEHEIIVSRMVPEADALAGLLHDASECIVNDLSRPLKRTLGKQNPIFAFEHRVQQAIFTQFGINPEIPESVHHADIQICVLEKRVLMPRSDKWDLPYDEPTGKGIYIACLDSFSAVSAWLRRYGQLTGQNMRGEMQRYRELMWQGLDAVTKQDHKNQAGD